MNVINVVKPLEDSVISNIIKETILERHLINVISVVMSVHKKSRSFSAGEKSNEYNHELSGS
ncbi:Zinc finger protein 998 [Apodemus speciosus]|uniref:Zinc finger protein 998 n=1 Tax=Apodemus speciosus TaxID=105296 RepID=A0ABQ0FW19_APOSI